MLYFFTAIYPEAAPIAGSFGLKREAGMFGTLFSGSDAVLTVSGSGSVAMAAAAAETLSKYPPKAGDLAVNVGICGAPETYPLGNCYRIHKITDAGTGRDFYPDILTASLFPEAPLTTYPAPCPAPETLSDMESSAFYETVSKAFAPDRIFLYKIVSDHGIPGGVQKDSQPLTAQAVTESDSHPLTAQDVTESVRAVFDRIRKETEAYASLQSGLPRLSEEAVLAADSLCRLLDASVTMQNDIQKYALYLQFRNGNAAEAIQAFLREEGLTDSPPLRRKEGKLVLERFRRYCLR